MSEVGSALLCLWLIPRWCPHCWSMDHTLSREAGTWLIHLCLPHPVTGIDQVFKNCLLKKKKQNKIHTQLIVLYFILMLYSIPFRIRPLEKKRRILNSKHFAFNIKIRVNWNHRVFAMSHRVGWLVSSLRGNTSSSNSKEGEIGGTMTGEFLMGA